MTSDALVDMGLCEASGLLAHSKLSPVELTEAYLDRIGATEPALNAYVTVCADEARAAARAATEEIASRGARSPLHGIPVGVKDVIDTSGVRTTYGSALYGRHVPERDATVVADLRRAGAVILGKHATHELAWGGRTDNPHFGPTHNPYDHDRIPGGSSGGAAASVVAHSSLGAVGTDTAGSVRIPAALSGCVGLKPTRGSISVAGVLPLAFTLDHVGVLGRSVDDVGAMFGALTHRADVSNDGPPMAATALRVGRLRGWPESLLGEDVRNALETACVALAGHGLRPVDVVLPDRAGLTASLLDRIVAEATAVHRRSYAANPDAFGPDVAGLLAAGPPGPERLTEGELLVAQAGADLLDALRRCDVLVGATVPVTAPRIGDLEVAVGGEAMHVELALTRLTSLANAVGLPALSVPIGLADGLPVGLQVIGRRRDEASVLAAGRAVEVSVGALPVP